MIDDLPAVVYMMAQKMGTNQVASVCFQQMEDALHKQEPRNARLCFQLSQPCARLAGGHA